MRHFFWFIFLFISTNLYSQNKNHRSEISLISDNDAYLARKQDQYYTNGLFLSFKSSLSNKHIKDTNKVFNKIWQVSLAQKMYNPYSGKIKLSKNIDRPFAGYLYTSGSMQWIFKNENSIKSELQIGVLGPASLAQKGQELYHDIFNFYNLRGWETQIKNDFAINLLLSTNHFLMRNRKKTIDISIPSELRIGNPSTGLKTGLFIRTGKLNKLNQSVATATLINYNKKANNEIFFYYKPSIDFVVYDASISGGLFLKDKGPVTFNTKPIIFIQELGLNLTSKSWALGFGLTLKTKEVKSPAKAHQYGTILLSKRF